MASLVLLCAAGCGGSKLPRPRVSADDEEPAPVVAQNPRTLAPAKTAEATATGTPAPTAAPGPNSPVAPSPPANDALLAVTRRREAVARMSKIYVALQKFRGQAARYPDQVVVDRDGRWLLSWRVQLLPYLGHQDLYASFKLDEPWNSTHNLNLTRQIPDVFKSPERNDEKTCIQLMSGPKTAYELPGGLNDRTCPDGMANTLLLVETNPELAKPWTQPEDYQFNALRIQQDLFTHRQDGALVLLGGDLGVRLLPANIPDDKLLGLITPTGKEKVDGEALSRPAGAEPYQDILDSLRAAPTTRQLANLLAPAAPATTDVATKKPAGEVARGTTAAPTRRGDDEPGETKESAGNDADSRPPLPGDAEVADAAEQIRKLYAEDYKSAKKVDDRRKFAKKMLDEAKQVEADRPAYYVMLKASRDVAAGAGDLAVALDACNRLKQEFQFDEFAMFVQVLEQASPQLTETSGCDLLYDESMRLADLALEHDDFSGAKQALKLSQNAARRMQKQDDLAAVNKREDEINSAKAAFQKIAPHLLTLLRTPEQPTANAAVGRYTSLVKRDWTKGLAMLAKGDDAPLRQLAEDDLSAPVDHDAKAALADAWWDWSEKASSPIEKASAQLRAIHWYKQAIPGLAPSLTRVRAERRVADVENAGKNKKGTRARST